MPAQNVSSRPAKRAAERRPMVENRLRLLRERGRRNGGMWLTIEEAAKVLGLSLSAVSLHETNKRSLSEEDVVAYAKLYKVRPDQLFRGLTDSKRR